MKQSIKTDTHVMPSMWTSVSWTGFGSDALVEVMISAFHFRSTSFVKKSAKISRFLSEKSEFVKIRLT